MKHFDLDWAAFFDQLPAWSNLPIGARGTLLDMFKPSGSVRPTEAGADLPEMLASGLIIGTDTRAMVAERARPFVRALRAMDRHRGLLANSIYAELADYLAEHFTNEDTYLLASQSPQEYGRGWVDRYRLAQQLASAEWVEEFLSIEGQVAARAWEKGRRRMDDPTGFASAEGLVTAQQLVRLLVSRRHGLLLRELPGQFPSVPPADLGAAIYTTLRYVLCYAILDPDSLEPRIGIWPPLSERLGRAPIEPPGDAEVVETFHAAWLLEDMTALLIAAAGSPLRLRGQDHEIFARQRLAITGRLVVVPDWVATMFELDADTRLSRSARHLRSLGLMKATGVEGKDLRLETDKRGARWLALADRARLASLLDPWRKSAERNPSGWYSIHTESGFFPFYLGFDISRDGYDLRAAVETAFLSAPSSAFVPLADFLAYHGREQNPFLVGGGHRRQSHAGYYGGSRPFNREGWEDLWRNLLSTFLSRRLAALGGVRLGRTETGRICFHLTDAGRYLLGAADDFDYGHDADAEVVVQPNFEVVFLAPAPQIEAQLSRIAVRVGNAPGVVFHLTRESILTAAESGLGLDQVLGSLRSTSARELPANVDRQIRDWFGGVRRIELRPTLLIRCPDPETAARVRTAAGNGLRHLTETCLEMPDTPQARKTLARKLRKAGVFIDN